METIRVGLVGAGRIGRIHAENLALRCPGAQLAWVADALEPAAKDCGERFGAKWTTDVRRVLDDKELRAVVICSPTDLHARQIREVAEAGKDIFCEKPIDFDLGRIDEALGAVERAKVRLQMGFNRRFDPSFARAREMVQKGQLGVPHLVRITSRDPKPPPPDYVKASGGLFCDMTIHDFDMARWVVGLEVEEVFAFAGNLVDPEIQRLGDIDTAIVSLRYKGGALGAIDNSRRAVYGYDQRVEVFGSKGAVMVGNRAPTQVTVANEQGFTADLPQYFFLERYEEAYRAEMRHFVECVREKKTPSVSGADGRAPIVLAQAASLSVKEGRAVRIASR
jgi:myo-inositol 2-dehydrogenase / D-chiro-inositol 1-dehydrogenase